MKTLCGNDAPASLDTDLDELKNLIEKTRTNNANLAVLKRDGESILKRAGETVERVLRSQVENLKCKLQTRIQEARSTVADPKDFRPWPTAAKIGVGFLCILIARALFPHSPQFIIVLGGLGFLLGWIFELWHFIQVKRYENAQEKARSKIATLNLPQHPIHLEIARVQESLRFVENLRKRTQAATA